MSDISNNRVAWGQSKNHHGCPYPVGDCACPMSKTDALSNLGRVADIVLAYRPKPKTKAAKRRIHKKKKRKEILF